MDFEKIQLFVSLKWRRFHAILSSVGQSYHPGWRNQTLFFFYYPRVPNQPLTFDLSPCSQPSSRVTHRQQVYQTLAKASSLSPIRRGANPREVDAFLGESKGHQIELRGFAPCPQGW